MIYTVRLMLFLSVLATIALCNSALASMEVFFSPAGNAKERLITAISSTKDSIDMASFQFTSVDIAEALLEAKGRGVRVRLVVDKKQSQDDSSVVPHLQEEGLDVRYIKGHLGGRMHHSFIIFDSRAVFTGTYNPTEYSEKFNYENAILTDEPRIVAKFQEQFNKLYGKPPVPAGKAASVGKGPRRFIGLSLSHLGKLLGEDSMLPESEKRVLWSHCRNFFIRGEGEIVSSSIDSPSGPLVTIRDRQGVEAEILLEAEEARKLSGVSGGEWVGFQGRLLARPGNARSYFRLDRGILK